MTDLRKILKANDGSIRATAKELGVARSTLRCRLAATVAANPEVTLVEEHRMVREIKRLKAQLAEVVGARADEEDLLGVANQAAKKALKTRRIVANSKSDTVATAITVLSDTHYDEVVDPVQVHGINEYDRKIAEQRTANYFANVATLVDVNRAGGLDIGDLVLCLGGDIVSGDIHDELRETNESSVIDTALHWSGKLASGIEHLASKTGCSIYVPCVVGNHGRMTKKPVAKGKVKSNFDYLIYKLVEKHFAGNEQVQIDVAEGSDARFQVYRAKYLLTHGDQFRGGSGIAGALSPLLLGQHRKSKREAGIGQPYDTMILGHWHQLIWLDSLVVNGSLKGYDEYAYHANFAVEPPRQAFWLTTHQRYRIMQTPVFVD